MNEKEQKLYRLALDPAAKPGEVQNAALALIASMRARGVSAYDRNEQFYFRSPPPPPPKPPADWPGRIRMRFGKYEGERLDEIDPGYLRWAIQNFVEERHADLVRAMRIVLNELQNRSRY